MSAVLKENHQVETIFDYDLTDEEHRLLACGLSKNDYLEYTSEEGIYLALASLFSMRGDKDKSKQYLKLIDEDYIKTHITWDVLIH